MADFYCEAGSVRRVAVIGAGVSGLVAIKSCLEEDLKPVCFERSSYIGGLWAPHKTNYDREAFTYSSVIFNSSKEMTCFSDFPYPRSYPPYLGPKHQYEYLKSYADHFGLMDYIRFNTTVVRVSPTPQSTKAGSEATNQRWRICVRKTLETGTWEDTEEIFDAVMICIGIQAVSRQPEYPGQDGFPGRVIHSCRFRQGTDYKDENVLVVFLSSKGGITVLPRFVNGGVPVDAFANTLIGNYMPQVLRMQILHRMLLTYYNPKHIGMEPLFRLKPLPAFMVNDEIIQRILYGLIKLKPSVEEFKSGKVVFSDDTSEEVDTVIFATGYATEFPFIDDSILPDKLEDRCLYLHVFPTTPDRPTLVVIGLVSITGATGPIFEMQARCAATVFKGLVRLPSERFMERHVAETRAECMEQYGRPIPVVSLVPAMSELGKLTGCFPDFWRIIFRGDFKLASHLLFKPFFPYWMRLEGRHSWPGARQAIIDGMDNMFSATRSESSKIDTATKVNWKAIIVLLSIVILIIYQFRAWWPGG